MKRILFSLAVIWALCFGLFLVVGRWSETAHAQSVPAANGAYKYIATNTTTIVKPTSGYLHTVTINTGAAGAITLFDIAAAGCTGTPASGKFATIRAGAATDAPVTVIYDLATVNGICVVTAAATDLTVSFN